MPITASQAVSPWTYTPHARTRAAQRGVTELEIDAVLHRPTITYPQPQHGPDRQMMIGSGLAIAVNTATRTVITVLFQDHRRYTAAVSTNGVAA